MLRLLQLSARTSPSARGTSYLRSVQNRAYSSNPLQSHLDIIKSSASKNSRNSVIGARRSWATKEDTETLNSLLHLAKSRQFDELFKSLKDNPSLTQYMFVKVIQANWQLPSKREIELKEKIMQIMKKRGVIQTAFSITPMITLYGNVGDFDRADGLLCMMKKNRIKRSDSTYNSMMKCHLNNKAKVSDLCDQMIEDGIKPNVYTYNTMIRAFSKDASKVDELYRKMIGDGIKPNVYIYSLMIDIYAKSGKMEEVDKMFGSMKKDMITPNVVTYTAMINAYSNDGKFVKAVDLFDLMIAESIEPNVLTYSSMIDIYAKGGRLEKADEMFRLMKKDGMKPDLVTYTTIIDAYAKSGNSEKAIEVFVSFKEDGMKPDFTIYSTILNCYAKSGRHIADMIGIFKEMRESSIVLEIRAWNNLMEGYCRAEGEGDRKKALSIWKYLSGQISHENLGIDLPEKTPCVYPSNVTLSIGLDVCKFGRFEKEADEVWMYGQENEGIVLVSNVLTSYVEALATFSEKGADRVVELIISGMKGEKIPLRCVRPNEKTIANAKRELIDHGWEKHAAMLDGLVIED